MIIDAHVHLYHNPKDLDRIVNSGLIEQAWIMNTYYACDKNDPDGCASQEEILEVAKEYKGFFIPFGFLDFRKNPDVVDELHSKGFAGLKAIMPGKPYNDPSYFPYYQRAEKLRMPVLFHTGVIGRLTRKEAGEGLSLGPTNMRPTMLNAIAMEFPKLTIIGGHLGWPWVEETKQNLGYYPNIYHDISGGYGGYLLKWMIDNLDMRCHDGVHKYLTDKILFATDARYGRENAHNSVFRNIKFWELFFEIAGGFHHWGEKQEIEKIMRSNAKRITKNA